ncbi:MAG: NADPH-dependent 7-cyano-7-deazaguanine reductase QueF [Verrucomicrobia bacterium]|nr:NADPH-dependent 7-cyano-7-deazaguanine reductase QueF [Verrucomicrobiota bacterium]
MSVSGNNTTDATPNHQYPNLKLLGNTTEPFPDRPTPSILETFENRYPGRDYWIRFDVADFTSLCPITGQPDFARIEIRYVPDELCIESKSLKFYLTGYRNAPSFNEEVVNRILDDLVGACRPRKMFVRGEFAARGGISLTVEATHPNDAELP